MVQVVDAKGKGSSGYRKTTVLGAGDVEFYLQLAHLQLCLLHQGLFTHVREYLFHCSNPEDTAAFQGQEQECPCTCNCLLSVQPVVGSLLSPASLLLYQM